MLKLQTLALLVATLTIAYAQQETDSEKYVKELRTKLGVYSFTSSDYPASFAIVAGVSIILIIAVIFIVVGMLSSDPGKDSIIYRMTTTRMKKD